jgi:signal transduction histidine kinase
MSRQPRHSPTALPSVLKSIAQTAAKLCDARDARISLVEGDRVRLVASAATAPVVVRDARPVDRRHPQGDAILRPRVLHIRDVRDRYPLFADVARASRMRTVLVSPLMRGRAVLGVMLIHRDRVRPFTPKQIALLKTLADQAAIAVENARRADKVAAGNRALSEALEQQTATAEILRVISSSPTDLRPVFEIIARSAARLCDGVYSAVARLDGERLHIMATYNYSPAALEFSRRRFPSPPSRQTFAGRCILERDVVHVPNVLADADVDPDTIVSTEFRSALAVPMLHGGRPVGAIVVWRAAVGPFAATQIDLLRTFADQAVIAIENARLLGELQARNDALTEALEQQTATSEILQIISSSPTQLTPVLSAIAERAARLCDAWNGTILLSDGQTLRMDAHYGPLPEQAGMTLPIGRTWVSGRAFCDGRPIHVEDLSQDEDFPLGREIAIRFGVRTTLAVPLIRQDAPIGVILVRRTEVRRFSDKQIALLRVFADQAVIAIENARLFNELETRTRELTRSVEQLTALGEVGQAVSSTLDLETVLTTIASRATQLTATDSCTVYEYDEAREQFDLRATHNLDERVEALIRARSIRKGEGATGRVAETHAPVQIEDIAHEPGFFRLRQALLEAGVRSVLAVPLLREQRLIGTFIVSRKTPGRFADEVLTLLQTFATQSAIAIHNARLYRELEAKSRELEAASHHKSLFLANMSHELRTPMNAIIGYTELIADGIYGTVPAPMQEVLTRVDASGRHLLGLINDVLDLSKIEAGQLTLTLAEYSMKEVIEAVLAAAEPLAAEKRLKLVVDLPPDLPTGRADQRRLAQVLLNLVGNAIKFTDEGHVALRVGAAAGVFAIAVSDTGPGIPEADHERIFEEFQQADTSRTRPKGGTGLGLAIARRIVTMHGGRIWVESTPGAGATFRITMPVCVDAQVVVVRGAQS